MGSASSSQSGSTFYSVLYFYNRPSSTEQPPSQLMKPPGPSATVHSRAPSAPVPSRSTASIKVKERQAWYRQLRHKTMEQEAKESALVVRSLIVGPPTTTLPPKVTKVKARPELTKIKSHLVKPKSANRIISELRILPVAGEQEVKTNPAGNSGHKHATGSSGPIHAVCLEHTDAEEDRLHFSRLKEGVEVVEGNMNLNVASMTNIGLTSIDKLASLINEIHVIDLIRSPDLGLGQPGDGDGILAGAVPTAETVIKGIEQITPQLMALGYATGKAIQPDHKEIFPPTDRMSVLTYWWGLELLLPPPSLGYLSNAQSITGAVMNFLTALSLVNNGVREILPLVRYISQFIDFEFAQIKKQDHGKGVVCAATWIMPAALVPRPWDFPNQPIPSINPPKDKDNIDKPSDELNPKPDPTLKPLPSNGMPFLTPVPMHSILDTVPMVDGPASTDINPAT